MKTKKLLISALVSAVLSAASTPFVHAGLQEKMDSMFGEMSNITNPGVFETQRRGVISGGLHLCSEPHDDNKSRQPSNAILEGWLRWHRPFWRLL